MAAVAAARTLWAAWRRRARALSRLSAPDVPLTTRLALLSPLLVAGAIVLCAAIGCAVGAIGDSRLKASQHVALERAIEEFHAESGDAAGPDDGELRRIARRAGLADLRFEANPTGQAGREIQSLHDARGRIVGWFSWPAGGALAGAMSGPWGPLAAAGAVGAVVALSGLVVLWASRRLVRALARSTESLRKLTSEDRLTGLPNHDVMVRKLGDALAGRRSDIVVFAVIDPDDFREVNDTLGRSGGDDVLRKIAEHLQAALPPGALLGRFEENEFAAILTSTDRHAAAALVESLHAALMRPFFVDRMWQMTAGIGVAQAPEDGTTAEELIRRAALALRAAKRDGRGRTRFFVPQIENDYAERRFLLSELQSAVALQAFDVHYQPIVAAEGGAMVGVEALLRWTHPGRGPIAPSVFIPLAEESGLMSQLGEIILRRALSDGARWPSLSIAVNLSPVQIRDPWLVDLVGAAMAEAGIASSRVVLEVTEGVLIDNPDDALRRLEALRALGVSIALDDFGTGYSSLSYLQKFPFDRLKIDRAFVASLGASGNAAAIIQSIVTLGHALGMKVLAEGVERDEQRVLLRLAGCDGMQGFLFAKPGPAAEIDKMLNGARRATA